MATNELNRLFSRFITNLAENLTTNLKNRSRNSNTQWKNGIRHNLQSRLFKKVGNFWTFAKHVHPDIEFQQHLNQNSNEEPLPIEETDEQIAIAQSNWQDAVNSAFSIKLLLGIFVN